MSEGKLRVEQKNSYLMGSEFKDEEVHWNSYAQ